MLTKGWFFTGCYTFLNFLPEGWMKIIMSRGATVWLMAEKWLANLSAAS